MKVQDLTSLAGKVACVTGGGRGIGKAIAELLADAGAAVLVTDILEDEAEGAAAAIRAAGGQADAIRANAGAIADAEKTIRDCVARFGRIDILVNNAAVWEPGRALDVSEADWDRMVDVGLKGVFFHCQAAARAMIAGGEGGRIVNIASLDALHPAGVLAVYDATKGGVLSLTRSLAREWGPAGITVNAVAPGATMSPGSEMTREKMKGLLGENYAHKQGIRSVLGRIGQPIDVAAAVLYLATDMGSYTTGETLIVDGGYWLL